MHARSVHASVKACCRRRRYILQTQCAQAAATTIVASVMHGAYIGLDITRKLTIPNTAKLPTAAPVPGAAAQPSPDEAPLAAGSEPETGAPGTPGMHDDPAAGAENAPAAVNRAAAAARVPDRAIMHDVAEEEEQQVDCPSASEAECLSADTSHHAQVAHEEQHVARGILMRSTPHEQVSAGSRGGHAWQTDMQQAPMRQARIPTPTRMVSTGGPQGWHAAERDANAAQQLQQQQRCRHQARKALPFDSTPAESSGAQQGKGVGQSSARAQTGKHARQLPLFEAFRFNASAKTPGGPRISIFVSCQRACL